MRHLLIIGPTPPPLAGPEIITSTLIRGLAHQSAFDVAGVSISMSRSNAERGRLSAPKIAVSILRSLQVTWLAFTWKPDVVYYTISQTRRPFLRDLLFLWSPLLLRQRVVIHLHGGRFDEFYCESPTWLKWLIRLTFRRITAGIVLGHKLRHVFRSLLPENRIFVVYNGIDGAYFRGEGSENNRADGKLRVLFVGTLQKRKKFIGKGYQDVLKAAPLVVARYPEARFDFVGQWSSQEARWEAERFVTEQGIDNNVRFLGMLTGQPKYDAFTRADVFVFPPTGSEGQPVVILEAMAAGLPIIATDTGSITEMVMDGWNGFIVPKEAPGEIALRITQLAENSELRHQMGQRSLARFEEMFTADAFVRRMSRVFLGVVEESYD